MLEQARKFLTNVLPPLPEGQSAYINIHWSAPKKEGAGKWWSGRAAKSVDEAVKNIGWVLKMGDTDIYVCMSLQAKAEDKTSGKGHSYRNALRASNDVVLIRSLFIDVDVKPDAYATTGEALTALQEFIAAVELPMPTAVVGSGSGGFHAHWALDEPLTRDQWQPLADALATATQTHGLMTDSQCTIDSARILRVPQTFNRKQELPRAVTLMSLSAAPIPNATMAAALAPYVGTHKPKPQSATGLFEDGTRPRARGSVPDNSELGAGIESSSHLIKVEDVVKQCGFIARALGTGGVDMDNPLWFMTANVATFLEDGRDVLHQMSNKHPGYSYKSTEELYDRADDKRKRENLGWTSCEKISRLGCKDCTTCPLLALGKSPLNFAPVAVPVEEDDTLPDRYIRSLDGIISYCSISEEGVATTSPVIHYPITSGWLSNNPWTFHFTTRTETGRKATMEIPTEVIFAKDSFGKYLGSKGMFATDFQYRNLRDFFVSWLQKLQLSKDSVISASPFGWSVVDGKTEGFTYAGRVWTDTTDRPAASPNPQLQYQYSPKGDIAPWREAAKVVYEQRRPGLDAILAVGFAGPLVRFTGFGGLILNGFSPESGIGKTTTMKASQAIWGSPVLAMQGLNDTANSVLGKMGQLRSLPMYWDEIKSAEQTKQFCGIVFNLTGGREKTRMNSDTTLRASGTWQTMMVSASNESLIDGMGRAAGSTTAGLHRLFEYQIPKTPIHLDIGVVQRLTGRLDDNYGNAGLIYAKFLGASHKRVEQEVADMQDRLYTEANVQQEERMWIATMAVLLKGAEYANELGLVDIDLAGLKVFLFQTLNRMRGEVADSPSDLTAEMSVSSILAEFINSQRARHTLVTNRIWVARGKPSAGAISISNDASRLEDIVVHIGQEDRLMRFSSVFFSRWMAEHGYSRHTWTKRMEEEFGLKMVHGKMGGGTQMTCAMEYLIELDMNHARLATLLD